MRHQFAWFYWNQRRVRPWITDGKKAVPASLLRLLCLCAGHKALAGAVLGDHIAKSHNSLCWCRPANTGRQAEFAYTA